MPFEDLKHGQYIAEFKPGYSLCKQIVAPQIGAHGTQDLVPADGVH